MKVAFMVPSTQYVESRAVYKRVVQTIKVLGHTLCLGDDESSLIELAGKSGVLDEEDWHMRCLRALNAAVMCDAAIVDVTNKSTFGVGYFAATALQAARPTLFLMHKDSLQGSIISGLRHKNLSRAMYDGDSVECDVRTFLEGLS